MSYDFLTSLTNMVNAIIAKAKAYTDTAIAAAASAAFQVSLTVNCAPAVGATPGTTTQSNLGQAIGGNGVMYQVKTTPESANTNTYDIAVLDDTGTVVYKAQSLSGPQSDDLIFHFACSGQMQVQVTNYGSTALALDVVLIAAKLNVH